jgi:tetratricopeptide (TPR) repeat protein
MRELILKYSFLLFLLLAAGVSGISQSPKEIEELYRDANSYFYFEDYEEALAIYLNVYSFQPGNSNLEYRIGICYLNIPGSKHRAIDFFEKATTNINKRYNENSLKETGAPVDAIFYLANAYFINNQLDKAQESYDRFQREVKSESRYNMSYFNHQLNSLKSSRQKQSYPVNFIRENLGEAFNDRFSNFNPVASGNGKVMAYTTKRRFQNVVFVARRDGKDWGTPQNITLDLVVDGNCSTLSLSYSGDELYLFRDDVHDGNIYSSRFIDGRWTPMQKLNANINTPSYETHAAESPDGKKLYFTSNRPGGIGDLDIYVSERTATGDWGIAANLGPIINTSFNENTPFLTADGSGLFFSSEAHNSIGGYDIFFSQLQTDGKWSKPINVGYPLNTTDDDLFFQPLGNGSMGLMATFDDEGYGEMDIYRFDVFLPKYQKSILTSSDLVAQKTNVYPKTLVVDTLSTPGIALLDASKLDNPSYLDPNRKVKLFFDGKKYNLKELIKPEVAVRPDITQVAIKDDAEKIKSNLDIAGTKRIEPVNDPITSKIDSSTIGTRQPLTGLDSSLFAGDSTSDPLRGQLQRFLFADSLRKAEQLRDIENLTKIVLALSGEELKPLLANALKMPLNAPAHIAIYQTSRIVTLADSTGNQLPLINVFVQLADIVSNQKGSSAVSRQPRSISSPLSDDDFFYKIQLLKQKATPGLAFFLDQIIINEPNINSFAALWDYIQKNKREEFQPYIKEFLELITQFAIEGFYGLTEDQKKDVLVLVTSKPIGIAWIISIVTSVVGLVIFLLLLFRRRKRRR